MSRRPASRVLAYMAAQPWLIRPSALESMLAIAARELSEPDVEALEAKLGRALNDEQRNVTVRDGIATVRATGPLFRYANFFTAISGATAFASLARGFTAAIEDPQVRAIILEMNSPGGEVDGTLEMAKLILEARGAKPIIARVGGEAASAAYWIASAADEIVAIETSMLGSIGAVVTIDDWSEADAKAGLTVYEFVSKQSPRKRPDPATAEGKAEFQRIADTLGQVFVESVAANRGVTVETVMQKYGRGALEIGANAVSAGLADRLGTYEEVHAELVARTQARTGFSLPAVKEAATMAAKTDDAPTPAAPARLSREELESQYGAELTAIRTAARTEGATAERTRILGIQKLARAGRTEAAHAAVNDPAVTPEIFARQELEAEAQTKKDRLQALEGDEAALAKPTPVGADLTDPQSDGAVASRVLSNFTAVSKTRRSA